MEAFISAFLTKRKEVIHGIPLDVSIQEIQECIKKGIEIDVINAFRLKKKNNQSRVWEESNTVCVEFKENTLPEYNKIWRVRISVLPYIPSVRICYKCRRIGHIGRTCENDVRCLVCGESHQVSKEEKCTSAKKCINCQGEHSTLDRSCPSIIRHPAIVRLMVLDNISFSEARRQVDNPSSCGEPRYVMKTPGQYPTLPARGNIQGFNKKNSDTYVSRVISSSPKSHLHAREGLTYKNSNNISKIVNAIFDSLGKALPEFSGKTKCLKVLRAKFIELPSSSSQEEDGSII